MTPGIPENRRGPRPGMVTAVGYLFYLPVLAGFVLHTSPGPQWRLFGKYSLPYVVFLLILLIPAAAMPWLGRALTRPMRVRRPGKGVRNLLCAAPEGPFRQEVPDTFSGGVLVISGWRKLGFAGAAALLSVVVGGAIAEVALAVPQLLRRSQPPPRPHDHEVFFEHWPTRGPRTNGYGWRGPDLSPAVEKPPGTYRVFALGGSTTWLGAGLKPEETFIHLLGQSLQAARPAWRIEVINAAAGGHTTVQSLVKYATLVQNLQPDLVLVMHAINDACMGVPEADMRAWGRPFERDYGHRAEGLVELLEQGAGERPQEPLWAESRVLAWLVAAVKGTFLSDLRVGRSEEERRQAAAWATTRSLPMFRRNLRTLGQLVAARGARLVIVSQPTMYGGARPEEIEYQDGAPWSAWCIEWWPWCDRPEIYARAWVEGLRRFNDAAREVAAELGADFIDLERAVPRRWEHYWWPEDGIHLNAEGCVIAARALHAGLLPLIPEEGSGFRVQGSAPTPDPSGPLNADH